MSLDEKEITMSDEAFEKIASIAITDAGLSIPISKKGVGSVAHCPAFEGS